MESLPQLSFEVLFYCRGPEVIKGHGNAQVDPSEVLNQVYGKIRKAFRSGHRTVLPDHHLKYRGCKLGKQFSFPGVKLIS